jgi:hypothetical protein
LIPNKTYEISCYGEEKLIAKYIREERGFYIFYIDGIRTPIRKQFVRILGDA